MRERPTDNLERDGGIALAGAAVLSVLLMMNHPTSAQAGAANGTVHSGMILALGALLFGFAAFAIRRGPRTPVLAGLIAYAVAAGAHVGAATINGFAVPAMATHDAVPSAGVFVLAWELNQALAGLGTFATGLAFGLWAMDLRRDHRLLALAGAVAGIVPAVLLASGIIRLDVHGALLAYGLHGLWALALGVTMARRRLAERV